MALTTATSLTVAVDAGSNVLSVTSATGVTAGRLGQVDGEYVKVTAAPVGSAAPFVVPVQRGYNGTKGAAHNALAPIVFGDPVDFPSVFPKAPSITSYSATATVVVPDGDQIIEINGAAAITLTLPAPTAAQEGVKLTFVARTAFAHIINTAAAGGFSGGAGATDVGTFAAAVGNNLVCVAMNSLWHIIGNTGVTVA